MQEKTIPHHVAFIMDGNRRWAKQNRLSLLMGHSEGAKRIEYLVEYAGKHGVKFLTFWAFSTENWKRDKKEVQLLLQVFRSFLKSPVVKRVKENNVRLKVIGNFLVFPKDIVDQVETLIVDTVDNDGIIVTFALNYGGRVELLQAMTKIISEKKQIITEEEVAKYLYTYDLPDPDLIIRTGGDMRLSGFLPWQAVYSELYFTKTYWPDFDKKEFEKALKEYAKRQRRFGK